MWVGVGRYGNFLLALATNAILSRLLTPLDFGWVAMVQVFFGFISILADAGLPTTVVQLRTLEERGLSTAFWMSLLWATLVSAGFIGFSGSIAAFYGLPHLRTIAIAVALTFVLSSVGLVPRGLLRRRMRFASIAFADVSATCASSLLAILLAFRRASYWALVAGLLIREAVGSVLLLQQSKWRPRMILEWRILHSLWRYSRHLTLFNLISYWARNIDSVLIGRVLGAADLGHYDRAFAIMSRPGDMVASTINPVVHPTLAALQTDPSRLYRAYLHLMKLTAILCLPIMSGLAVMAPEVVLTLLGAQWMETVVLFRILSLVGAVQPLMRLTGNVFIACNRTNLLWKVWGVNGLAICVGIVAGLPWGVRGVAVGYSVAHGIILVPTIFLVIAGMPNTSVRELFEAIKVPIFVSVNVAAVVSIVGALTGQVVGAPVRLLIAGGWGGVTYLVSLFWLDRPFLKEMYLRAPLAVQRRVEQLSRWGLNLR